MTGAGRGIGEEIARTLVELGADVAVNDLYEDAAASTAETLVEDGDVVV